MPLKRQPGRDQSISAFLLGTRQHPLDQSCREHNEELVEMVHEMGMTPIHWNIDSNDWRHVAAGEEPGQALADIESGMDEVEGMVCISRNVTPC